MMAEFSFVVSFFQNAWLVISTFIAVKILCPALPERPFQQLDDPTHYGLKNTINIRIPIESKMDIGGWLVCPYDTDTRDSPEKQWKAMLNSAKYTGELAEEIFNNKGRAGNTGHICDTACPAYLAGANETMILFLHGNSGTRYCRKELYEIWQNMGLHVFAIDYRGFGDSYGGIFYQTSQTSLVQDGVMSVQFLKKYIHPSAKLIVWAHSLGTGVASRLAYELKDCIDRPDGFVLEAPFNHIEEVRTSRIQDISHCETSDQCQKAYC